MASSGTYAIADRVRRHGARTYERATEHNRTVWTDTGSNRGTRTACGYARASYRHICTRYSNARSSDADASSSNRYADIDADTCADSSASDGIVFD